MESSLGPLSPLPMPIAITLTDDARPDKYGIVVVTNPDGTFNREYRITEKELADLHASANGVPPGVTQKEWESGLATVAGKGMDVGDIVQTRTRDGVDVYKAKVAEGIDALTGRLTEDFLIIPVADAVGEFPAISVADEQVNGSIVTVRDGTVTLVSGVLTKG